MNLKLEVTEAGSKADIIKALKQAIELIEEGITSISSCGGDDFAEVDFDIYTP